MNTWTKRSMLLLALGLAIGLGSSAAQAHPRGLDARERALHTRVERGMASGQLTNWEGQRLNRKLHRIERLETRFAADGRIGPRERVVLRHQLNHSSRAIFREKHDRQRRCR